MLSIEASVPLILIAVALLALLVFLQVRKKRVRGNLQHRLKHHDMVFKVARITVAVLSVVAGFLMLEILFDNIPFTIDAYHAFLQMVILAVLFVFVFFIGQRSKTSIMVFLFLCFTWGLINGFVAEFKGHPVFPSDVLAINTAVDVMGGYTYVFGNRAFCCIIGLELFAIALTLLPDHKIRIKQVAINLIVAAVVAGGSVVWFNTVDIEEDYDCYVNGRNTLPDVRAKGMLLSFLCYAQKIFPEAPANYSEEEALSLLEGVSENYADSSPTQEDLEEAARAEDEDLQPSVIVIMNETFSDLSAYSALDDSYEGLMEYYSIAQDSLLSGNAYVSVIGGATANSEFEFLTGSTMGMTTGEVYPYLFYDLQDSGSLVEYMKELGYETTAIHPAVSTNWYRDRVYELLGFDEFLDIDDFEDAEQRRNRVTDAATYDKVLEILENSDEPQFIFNLTINNHGGYYTGLISEDEYVSVEVEGASYMNEEVSEYISSVTQSDIELGEFIDALKELDRPVVVCFFGDHQPTFVEELLEISLGVSSEEMTLEQIETLYSTPYFIWTNSDELRETFGTGNQKDLSLNYLGANLLKLSGLALNDQFAYLLAMEQLMPVINYVGYRDIYGRWYEIGDESDLSPTLEALSIVQYYCLF